MILTSSTSPTEAFDYVIVGAGSAGCVLASRLSADPAIRVLLLEAGPSDSADAIRVPVLANTLFGSELDWNYELDTQNHYHGSAQFPRGKMLGGSSSINVMIYIRGHRRDFDGWAQRGCAGWDYDSVLPYFIKAECNSRLSAPLHGTQGPLYVEDRLFTHEMSNAWIDAADAWGLTRTDDFNGDTQLGAGSYQVTCHEGWRWSTADAYLRPALGRANLVVQVNSHTTRILFNGSRAVGVTYLHDGKTLTANAEREVILSAGAINSPQLLLLSGVGPADHLRAHHIDVIADLPGVGQNLHDHTMTPMVRAAKGSADLLQMIDNDSAATWQNRRGGPLASNGAEVGGFVSLTGDTNVADIQFMVAPAGFRRPRPTEPTAAQSHRAGGLHAPREPGPTDATLGGPAGPPTHLIPPTSAIPPTSTSSKPGCGWPTTSPSKGLSPNISTAYDSPSPPLSTTTHWRATPAASPRASTTPSGPAPWASTTPRSSTRHSLSAAPKHYA